MKTHASKRPINVVTLLGLMTLLIAVAVAPYEAAERASVSVAGPNSTASNVYWTWDPNTVVGTSTLVRTDAGISANLHSSMPAGQAVTMWFVVFDYPEFCVSSLCAPADMNNPDVKFDALYAGGHVIGASQTAAFGGHLAVGDPSGSFFLEQSGSGRGSSILWAPRCFSCFTVTAPRVLARF